MSVAPLANVFAHRADDPRRSEEIARVLTESGRFDVVWRPAALWVAATSALPLTEADGEGEREAGRAFVEGRDHALGSVDDVGLVAFDDTGEATVQRSVGGLVPLYLWRSGRDVAVASLLSDLVRFLPGELALDPLVCATWLGQSGPLPDGRTFFRDVTIVVPGATVEIGEDRDRVVSVRSPWPEEPQGWPDRRERARHVEAFREAVISGLEAALPEDERSLLTLSGGVDSSSLAAIAAGHLHRPLAALSLVPEAGHRHEAREWSYLRPLVEAYDLDPHVAVGFSAAARGEFVGRGPVVAHPVVHPALLALPDAQERTGARVLVGGEFADEICGGWFARPDWVASLTSRPSPRSLGAAARAASDLRGWIGWARSRAPRGPWRPLPMFVCPDLRDEHDEWRRRQVAALLDSSAPHRHIRAVRSSLDGVLTMNWEVCSALGMRRSFPFLTARVIGAVAACHPTELLGPGSKRLERQAFAGLVPATHLLRGDKGSYGLTRGSGEMRALPVVADPVAAFLDESWSGGFDAGTAARLLAMDVFVRHVEELRQRS